MTSTNKPNRRTVVAGQAALAVAAALPAGSGAMAATGTPVPGTAADTTRAPARWATATAEDLQPFIGQRFRVETAGHGSVVLRLHAVEPVRSGPHRPADLPRAEGVIAVFDSPDKDALAALGHGTHRMRHPRLGNAALYMGPVPSRSQGQLIEVILN